MKDEQVRRSVVALFFCIGMGLSGCNGCSGCEGQTLEGPTPAATGEQTLKVPEVAPSAVATPPASAVATPSAAPNPAHDSTGIRLCCKAIEDNVATAPDKHKQIWKSALEACNQALEKQGGRKTLAQVREILTPVGWPVDYQ